MKGQSLREKLNISYMSYYESILVNVKLGKGITLIPQSLPIRIEREYAPIKVGRIQKTYRCYFIR